jgi:hypothetical protein
VSNPIPDNTERSAIIEASLPELELITDPALRGKVVEAFLLGWELGGWESWEDAAYWLSWVRKEGTGLEFTRSTALMALAAAEVMENVSGTTVNRDYLLAGALLRDVGKFLEKAPKGQGRLSSHLLRHPFTGVHIALTVGLPLEIAHIIAASGPEGMFAHRSTEATIVAHAEMLAAEPIIRRELNLSVDQFVPSLTLLHTPVWEHLQQSWGQWIGPTNG